MYTHSYTGTEIAVIGMGGRFPQANNLRTFWQHLVQGNECITTFTEEELIAAGIDVATVTDPQYVKAYGWLAHSEDFDYTFFQYTHREAMLMDPQIRVLHEVVWEALEDAGYQPDNYPHRIGLYVGASDNVYWQAMSILTHHSSISEQFEASQLNDKDFLATQIAYKLNLRGPAVTVASACSTSLTTIHMWCQALLGGECEMVLAGGITISLPAKKGYLYQEGMILSPDGHCRAFDAQSAGIVGGNGAGVVALKLLDDALSAGDHIYAIIKGSAINNDGRQKVGYSAPSITGQVDVIRLAHRAAQIHPETITYVEAHGTATTLGDPVEIEALKQAFNSSRRHYCAIGSVKSNIGHLDSAAGVASFIKAVLMLQHKVIPPTVNFDTPNPHIDFQHSPFYINTACKFWKVEAYPRRAGVSSFGIGGTNAHLVLEEPPERHETSLSTYQFIPLSAQSAEQVHHIASDLACFIETYPDTPLHALAYTLQTGRKHMLYRHALVCPDLITLQTQLHHMPQTISSRSTETDASRSIIFMFPGQGAQYMGMGKDLFHERYTFAHYLRACLDILIELTPIDYQAIFYQSPGGDDIAVTDTAIAQPLLFVFEYVLAKVLVDCGVQPDALIGHSVGELVAACVANVFSLEDALYLVSQRGQLMQTMDKGAMVSVVASEAELTPFLDERHHIAAVNGPTNIVISGTMEAIAQLINRLQHRQYVYRKLPTSHAFHSSMMAPMLDTFATLFDKVTLHPPTIPFISNLTGTWITDAEATDPQYWCQQLRYTVQFNNGLQTLLDVTERNSLFIEVGPGNTLSGLFAQQLEACERHTSIHLVRHPQETTHDVAYLLRNMAHLWFNDVPINWQQLYTNQPCERVSLPTYPFERTLFTPFINPLEWVPKRDRDIDESPVPINDWFYSPIWKSTLAPPLPINSAPRNTHRCLLFVDQLNLGAPFCEYLHLQHYDTIQVIAGHHFEAISQDVFCINPTVYDHYVELMNHIQQFSIRTIVHLWSLTTEEPAFAEAQTYGLSSVLKMINALHKQNWNQALELMIVSNGLHAIQENDHIMPTKATLLGMVRVIPQEMPFIGCKLIDITLNKTNKHILCKQLYKEIVNHTTDVIVAYRGSHRWVQDFERVPLSQSALEQPPIKPGGVYVITGGLGTLGLLLAEHLTVLHQGHVALVGRTSLPPRAQWRQLCTAHSTSLQIKHILQQLCQIEEQGGKIAVYHADVSDVSMLANIFAMIETTWGPISGVIHAAATSTSSSHCSIAMINETTCNEHFLAKVYGTIALEQVLEHRQLDFCILFSSLAATLGGVGLTAYAAANSFMDSFVTKKNQQSHTHWISAQWDHWAVTGVQNVPSEWPMFEHDGMTPQQGKQAFDLLLSWPAGQVLIACSDLHQRLERWQDPARAIRTDSPSLTTEMAVQTGSPSLQEQVIMIWEELLGTQPISPHANFFELGGDSLKALSIIAKTQKVLGCRLELSTLFNHPTIDSLVPLLESSSNNIVPTIPVVDDRDFYPLCSAQQRLFIITQLHPASTSYNLPQIFLIEGELNRKHLELCIHTLIHRHEALRASFHLIDGQPLQRIHDHVDFQLTHIEIDTHVSNSLLHSLIVPFALDKPPLLRASLIRMTEHRFVLLIDIHHIITDGVSLQLFFEELAALYSQQPLLPISLRYRDYCVYEQRPQQTNSYSVQQQFWIKQFAQGLPLLELPTDFARKAVPSYDGWSKTFALNQAVSHKVRTLTTHYRTTHFAFFLAVMTIWLSKLSGQDSIVIGTPIQGRNHPDMQAIFGHFVDVLPLSNTLRRQLPFVAFLQEVHERMVQAFDNQDVSFADIVNLLKVTWPTNRNPLFDVMLVMQNQQHPTCELPGMDIKPYGQKHPAAKFDLSLELIEQDHQFCFTLEYCTDLFSAQTIAHYIAYFIALIDQVLEDDQRQIADMRLSTPAPTLAIAQDQLEFDWNE